MNFVKLLKSVFLLLSVLTVLTASSAYAQNTIPFDTEKWQIEAKAFVLENYKGKDAIYIQQGFATLKDTTFKNGTIEFDIYLTNRQGFPGVYFRQDDGGNEESFYLRAHLAGKADANQAAPQINGLVAWQLYFGDQYSFPYNYKYDAWTHIKLVVNDDKAQVFMDYSEKPNLSWKLKLPPRAGSISVGGSFAPMHYANFKIDESKTELIDFEITQSSKTEGIVEKWSVSGQFDEKELASLKNLPALIERQQYSDTISNEENNAANISWIRLLRDQQGKSLGNTVFTRLLIDSEVAQTKLFDFGYSDRVVVILNGEPLYAGNNRWRSRDYRYLGTIGLFDSVYLNLKQGRNTLLLAVSEDFGGWGVTGRFKDYSGIKIQP